MTIGAALFDVFGTVVDWRSGVSAVMAEAFAAKGLTQDAKAFADEWRGEYQPAMGRIRDGARGYVPLDDLHLENLEIVLARRGLGAAFSAAEKAALNKAWEKLPPWPDSVPGVAAIRRKMPAATCSNGSISLMVGLARFGGLTWDAILGAEIAKGYKPDPKVYRMSAAALLLEPGEALMVASHNADLAAAREAGLRTAFVARPDEKGKGLGESRPESDWDFAVESLEELAARL
ncbi:MAG: haloacid dehalogenase type II [Pikeienuella sp.]|uniref:haloacid dehalogenase type II n=1 Tax=Pikeienuella sp. TaxID=2831957 RepID=UPI003919FB45